MQPKQSPDVNLSREELAGFVQKNKAIARQKKRAKQKPDALECEKMNDQASASNFALSCSFVTFAPTIWSFTSPFWKKSKKGMERTPYFTARSRA